MFPDSVKTILTFQSILEAGAVKLLVELTKHENNALRLNGVWGLMVT